METSLSSGVETAKIIVFIEELNLTAVFLAESSIDLAKLLARLMVHSVMVKRDFCL